jgi:cell wall-associated NlpC family hydrolase
LNPASSISTAISRSAKPASKASAVIAVSGGMVASFALPASAATLTTEVKTTKPPVTAAVAAPSAAQAPLVSRSFGKISFSGVVKPTPVAAPVPDRTTDRASRSATRLAISPSSTQTNKAAAPEPAPGSAGVLGIAGSLAGIYYIYGGTTTAGFDCSGFTQYVFAKVGINLPRTAEAQRQATTPVSNPRPGDLVFFGAPAHHTGIYAGGGQMWDSPHTGKTSGLHSIWSPSVTYGRP